MWTTIRLKHLFIILVICQVKKGVLCDEEHGATKRPDCSILGGRCIQSANQCKGLVLHGYNFKNRVNNCICCISLKDDEKKEVKGTTVKKTKFKPKSSLYAGLRQSSTGGKCSGKAKNKCKNQDGKCRVKCQTTDREIPNGCNGGCKCCKDKGKRTCKQFPRCINAGGQCQIGSCSSGFEKLKVPCTGKCVCCKESACEPDESCTANGGSCVENVNECKGKIFGNCGNGKCKCCLPKGKCALVDEFECASNKDSSRKKPHCTNAEYQCDRDKQKDCNDNSDEQGCNFAEKLSCFWCKTWDSNGGATVDPDCKNSNYNGIKEIMTSDDPFIGCATKVYEDGHVWRGFQSWQRAHINDNNECEDGRDYKYDDESAFTRCWCKTANCNSQLCETCN